MGPRSSKSQLRKQARELLSGRLLDELDHIEIDVSPRLEPGLNLRIGKRAVEFSLALRTTTARFFGWIAGAVAMLGGVVTVIKWLSPVLVAYLSKPPP